MPSMAGNKQDFELPGDLGEKDPRRQEHPQGNIPGQGGHEVKLGSSEAKGMTSTEGDEAHAANNSTTNDPRHDNTAEHALEGGSRETMNRAKRQEGAGSDMRGEADDVTQDRSRYGGQGNTGAYDQSNTGSYGQQGTTGAYDQSNTSAYGQQGTTGAYDQSNTGAYNQGTTGLSEGTTGLSQGTGYSSDQTTQDPHGHHTHEGTSTGTENQSFITKAYNAVTGSGSGTGTSSTTGSSLNGGQSAGHNTRAGEYLDPASGRDTGVPGYAGSAESNQGGFSSGTTGTTGSTGYTQ